MIANNQYEAEEGLADSSMTARFQCGDEVRVIRTIRNDGSWFGKEKGQVLVEAGLTGIVRTYGFFLQTQIIFQVYFPDENKVVGVRNEELIPASVVWVPRLFHRADRVRLSRTLMMGGNCIAQLGDVVEIRNAYRNLENGELTYQIELGALTFTLDAAVFVPLEQE